MISMFRLRVEHPILHPSTSFHNSWTQSLVFSDLTFFSITTKVTSDFVSASVTCSFSFCCCCLHFCFGLLVNRILFCGSCPSLFPFLYYISLALFCCCSVPLPFRFLWSDRLCCCPCPPPVVVVNVVCLCWRRRVRKWWVVGRVEMTWRSFCCVRCTVAWHITVGRVKELLFHRLVLAFCCRNA